MGGVSQEADLLAVVQPINLDHLIHCKH
jgi:hypothetical protein